MPNTSEYGKKLLCRAICALLGDGTIQTRLANAHHHLVLLKFFSDAIPQEIWNDFSGLADQLNKTYGEAELAHPNSTLTPQQEMALTERLLSIYVGISGGNLIL